MSIPHLAIVAAVLLAAACNPTTARPPEIVVDVTACSHCGMFVSEPAFAAAYQADGEAARMFDDIGCMLDALRREPASPITVWVQDAAGAGWLTAGEAFFVASAQFRTPMGGGVLAYADASAAERAAAAHGGRVIRSLPDLMTVNGDAR